MGESKKSKKLKKLKKSKKSQKNTQKKLEKPQQPGQARTPAVAHVPSTDEPRRLRKLSWPSRYHALEVVVVEDLSATMRRIVLAPPEDSTTFTADIDADQQPMSSFNLVGEYVRVVVPDPRSGQRTVPEPTWRSTKNGLWPVWEKPTPPSRKYTVRRYSEATGELEINVTLHESGPGTQWARTVQTGDRVYVLGPKSGYRVSYDYDFYLMVVDQTGLPAVLRWIEQMPSTARGQLLIEVPSLDSARDLALPEGFTVEWIPREFQGTTSRMATAVMEWQRPEGHLFAWVAGESSSIRPIRTWLREQGGLTKSHGYSSGYWKDKSRKDEPVA